MQTPETSVYETDVDFAHSAAKVLNSLIDEKILTSEAVSNATDTTLTEFVTRFATWSAIPPGIDEERKRKLQTLFNTLPEAKTPEQRLTEKEEIIYQMRTILEKCKEEKTGVEGFVIFGSQMNVNKTPRVDDSDIDVLAIINLENRDISLGNSNLFEDTTKRLNKIKTELFPESRFHIELSHMFKEESFLNYINLNRKIIEMPYWGWTPDSTNFIGSLRDVVEGKVYEEEEVNARLHRLLTSTYFEEKKRRELEKIKSYFKNKV